MSLWLLLIWPAEAAFALAVIYLLLWHQERDTKRRIAEDDEIARLDALFELHGPTR